MNTTRTMRKKRKRRRPRTAPHASSSRRVREEAVEAGQAQEARPPAPEDEDGADLDPEARVRSAKSEEDKDPEEDQADQIEVLIFRHQVGVVRHVLQDNRASIASVVVNHHMDIQPVKSLPCIIQSFVLFAQLLTLPNKVSITPGLFVLTTRTEAAIIAAPEPGAQHLGWLMVLMSQAIIGQELPFM